MFHGPRFQVITALLGMSDDSISAELLVRDPQEMVAKPLQAAPLLHPVLLDGLVQLVGYRAQIDDWVAYPVGLGRVTLHGPIPAPGSTVRAAVRYRRPDARHVEADVDVLDQQGRVWLHGENWRYWRFLWPKELQTFSFKPSEGTVGFAWPLSTPRVVCYRVTRSLVGEMNPDWLARVYLTSAEWAVYRERPRLDWLFGRIAAKDAVRSWLREYRGLLLHPLEVELTNLPGGAPVLIKPSAASLTISIAHIEDEAIAVAAEAQGVGVDLVPVTERGPEFRELAFDAEELRSLGAADGDRLSWLHRAWCAKEAAAKAHRLGFDALPGFKVRRIWIEEETVEVQSLFDENILRVKTAVDKDRAFAFLILD